MTTATAISFFEMSESEQSRIAVLEIKVLNINEKIDDLKHDVKDLHDCLDRTRDLLRDELKVMREEATTQYNSLSKKFNALENFKNKSMYMGIGAALVIGWILGHSELIKTLL